MLMAKLDLDILASFKIDGGTIDGELRLGGFEMLLGKSYYSSLWLILVSCFKCC